MSHLSFNPIHIDQQSLPIFFRSGWQVPARNLRKVILLGTQMIGSACSTASLFIFHAGIASVLLLLSFPLWLLAFATMLCGRNPLSARDYLGLHGKRFTQCEFATDQMIGGKVVRFLRLQKTPWLLSLLIGDIELVGPRAVTSSEVDFSHLTSRHRLAVKPGIFSPWKLRQGGNIAYEPEWAVDLEYVQNFNLRKDIGIILRSLPAFFLNNPNSQSQSPRGEIFGIRFDNVTMDDAIDQVCHSLNTPQLTQVAFINADCINQSCVNTEYRNALKQADLVYADGVGVRIAGQILGCPVRENVNGTDMFPRLCRQLSQSPTRVFLLGGKPGVAELVATWMSKQFADLNVCGIHHGYYSSQEEESVLEQIKSSKANMVLVAFGVPKQDVWIRDTLSQSNVRVAIGVGGLFDFYSGRISRAPVWMREIGLEWMYRLMQEPQRLWRRYVIGNILFLGRAIHYRVAFRKQINQNRLEVSSDE